MWVRLIAAGAVIGTMAVIGLLPTIAGAQPSTSSCGSPSRYISGLSENGSSCSRARAVAKHALHKSVYVWKYRGFHCHGDPENYGGPPLNYTCKKASARIYFTDTKGSSSL